MPFVFVQKAGVEPARVLSPLDFESSASANSATSASEKKTAKKAVISCGR